MTAIRNFGRNRMLGRVRRRPAFALAVLGAVLIGIGYVWARSVTSCSGGETGTMFTLMSASSIVPAGMLAGRESVAPAQEGRLGALLAGLAGVAAVDLAVIAGYFTVDIGLSCSHAEGPMVAYPLAFLVFLAGGVSAFHDAARSRGSDKATSRDQELRKLPSRHESPEQTSSHTRPGGFL